MSNHDREPNPSSAEADVLKAALRVRASRGAVLGAATMQQRTRATVRKRRQRIGVAAAASIAVVVLAVQLQGGEATRPLDEIEAARSSIEEVEPESTVRGAIVPADRATTDGDVGNTSTSVPATIPASVAPPPGTTSEPASELASPTVLINGVKYAPGCFYVAPEAVKDEPLAVSASTSDISLLGDSENLAFAELQGIESDVLLAAFGGSFTCGGDHWQLLWARESMRLDMLQALQNRATRLLEESDHIWPVPRSD